MATEADIRTAAERLVGDVIDRVMYVGLSYDKPDEIRWDFGDWHWPEVGVQLTTATGASRYAVWDWKVTLFELSFAVGEIRSQWRPLQDDPRTARAWDLGGHERWGAIVGHAVTRYDLAFAVPSHLSVEAPIAIRLETDAGLVWIGCCCAERIRARHR